MATKPAAACGRRFTVRRHACGCWPFASPARSRKPCPMREPVLQDRPALFFLLCGGRVVATRTTRKREPDSSGTLRPPVRTARVPCSAFFTGRPLSCALSLERAGPVTASGLPKPRVPRRLIDRYCSPIFARGVEPRPCSHSSSVQIGAGLRAVPPPPLACLSRRSGFACYSWLWRALAAALAW